MSDDGSTIIIITPPRQQNLIAGPVPQSCTPLEAHLLRMLDKLMTGRDNGYSIEVKESDG